MRNNIFILIIFFIIVFVILFYESIIYFLIQNFKTKYKVGFIIREYGSNDFEALEVEKLNRTSSILGIKIELGKFKEIDEQYNIAKDLIKKGCKIIVFYNGLTIKNKIYSLSKEYENIKFILVDAILSEYPKNVISFSYDYQEMGGFIGSVLSVLSKNQYIGFIGSISKPPIDDIRKGVEESVNFYNFKFNKNYKFVYKFIDIDYKGDVKKNPFNFPEAAKELAFELYKNYKPYFLVCAAGLSNFGIYEIAKDLKLYLINFDNVNLNFLLNNNIAFSVIRNIDRCLLSIIKKIIQNKVENKNYIFNLSTNSFEFISSNILKISNEEWEYISIINRYIIEKSY